MSINEDGSLIARTRRLLAGMLGVTHNGARDQWGVLGYPVVVSTQDMWNRYNRGGIANRIVRAYPQATWRESPLVRDMAGSTDEEGDEYSAFVDAVNQLFRRMRVMHYMERADRLGSIGQFGILYMGFQDGSPLEPLEMGRPNPLRYMVPAGEPNVTVRKLVTNPADPRFGMPEYYEINSQSTNVSGRTYSMQSFVAHWTRCVHVAEMLDSDEVYSTPRLLPGYNHLLDLEKVLGSGAETFWLNARGGMALMADKDAKLSPAALQDMKTQADEFENQLRRMLALQGTKAEMLTTQVFDPSGNVERIMDQISGTYGIPKRILIGSERGELSSNQDENNWAARIDERQNNYATPTMVVPFVRTMIGTGNLPEPEGDWWVEWPDSSSLGPQAVAEIGAKKADTLNKYLSAPGADLVVPVEEFRVEFLGLSATSEYDDDVEDEVDLDETDPNVLAATDPVDAEDPLAVSGADAVQDTALNGAQIAALQSIAIGVGDGTMAAETAIQVIMAGFPGIGADEARAIIEPMVALRKETEQSVKAAPSPTPDAPPPAPAADDATSPEANLNRRQYLVRKVRTLRANSSPRSLYVRRDVLNGEEIRDHFRRQGLAIIQPEEMHVTVAYSRAKLDWFKIEPVWYAHQDDKTGGVTVVPGGPRVMDLFGKNEPRRTLVMVFSSSALSWRHEDFKRAGASWDFPDYAPHISLSYDVENSWGEDATVWAERLRNLEPWTGVIELGPEIFQEVKDGWSDGIVENSRAQV